MYVDFLKKVGSFTGKVKQPTFFTLCNYALQSLLFGLP